MFENSKYLNNLLWEFSKNSKPYPFALIKVVNPNLKEFIDIELVCGSSKIKILKPNWIS